jgi:hypothetical protein
MKTKQGKSYSVEELKNEIYKVYPRNISMSEDITLGENNFHLFIKNMNYMESMEYQTLTKICQEAYYNILNWQNFIAELKKSIPHKCSIFDWSALLANKPSYQCIIYLTINSNEVIEIVISLSIIVNVYTLYVVGDKKNIDGILFPEISFSYLLQKNKEVFDVINTKIKQFFEADLLPPDYMNILINDIDIGKLPSETTIFHCLFGDYRW